MYTTLNKTLKLTSGLNLVENELYFDEFLIHRSQRRQGFGGAITMSDVIAHIETIKNAATTNGDRSKLEGCTTAMPENDITGVDVEPFDDHALENPKYYDGKDSKSNATGGYARLIE